MNRNHSQLLAKFVNKPIFMAAIMLVQAIASAELAFSEFTRLQEDDGIIDGPSKALRGLSYARFFCESCGWYALAVNRLRHDGSPEIKQILVNNKKRTDALYELKKEVNHLYNEELADSYRNNNYKPGKHQKDLVFFFSINPKGPGFKIGTLEVSMVSQLASMQKLETEILALN